MSRAKQPSRSVTGSTDPNGALDLARPAIVQRYTHGLRFDAELESVGGVAALASSRLLPVAWSSPSSRTCGDVSTDIKLGVVVAQAASVLGVHVSARQLSRSLGAHPDVGGERWCKVMAGLKLDWTLHSGPMACQQAMQIAAQTVNAGGNLVMRLVMRQPGVRQHTAGNSSLMSRWVWVTGVEAELKAPGQGAFPPWYQAIRALLVLDSDHPPPWCCAHNARLQPAQDAMQADGREVGAGRYMSLDGVTQFANVAELITLATTPPRSM